MTKSKENLLSIHRRVNIFNERLTVTITPFSLYLLSLKQTLTECYSSTQFPAEFLWLENTVIICSVRVVWFLLLVMFDVITSSWRCLLMCEFFLVTEADHFLVIIRETLPCNQVTVWSISMIFQSWRHFMVTVSASEVYWSNSARVI